MPGPPLSLPRPCLYLDSSASDPASDSKNVSTSLVTFPATECCCHWLVLVSDRGKGYEQTAQSSHSHISTRSGIANYWSQGQHPTCCATMPPPKLKSLYSYYHSFGPPAAWIECLNMLQAMADVVKTHLDGNVACSRRLLHRCPMCRNPTCANMQQFFARSQKIIDQSHQWILQFVITDHFQAEQQHTFWLT